MWWQICKKEKLNDPNNLMAKKFESFYIGRLNPNCKTIYFVILVEAGQKFTIALVSSILFLLTLIRWEVN